MNITFDFKEVRKARLSNRVAVKYPGGKNNRDTL